MGGSSIGQHAKSWKARQMRAEEARAWTPQLVIDMLQKAAMANPKKIALREARLDKTGAYVKKAYAWFKNHYFHYKKYTWKKLYDVAKGTAASFVNLGLKPMDTVNIRGPNSPA